jgi:hypothetical protein
MHDATVSLTSGQGTAARSISVRDLQLEITPHDVRPQDPRATAAMEKTLQVRGTGAADHLERLQFEAVVPADPGLWDLRGQISGLRLSPQLYQAIPEPWRDRCGELESVKGRVSLAFHVCGDSRTDSPPRFAVTGELTTARSATGGSRTACTTPAPVSVGTTSTWPSSNSSPATVFPNWSCPGSGGVQARTARYPSKLDARRLKLDQRFAEILPATFQQVWQEYSPHGEVDADVQLEFDGQQWHPQAQVTCRDVSLVYHEFPYRLERTRGQISLAEDVLSVHLEAGAGEQTVTSTDNCTTRRRHDRLARNRVPPPDSAGRETAERRDRPRRSESARVASTGRRLDGGWTLRATSTGGSHPPICENRSAQLQHALRPLPLPAGDDPWNDRLGRSGLEFPESVRAEPQRVHRMQRQLDATEDGGSLLVLNFAWDRDSAGGRTARCFASGRSAIWREIRPQGALDHLQIVLQYRSAQDDLSVEVHAREWKKRLQDEGRSITVAPKSFPYRVDDLTGIVVYRNGEITFQRMSAQLENASISLDGLVPRRA